MTSFAEQFGEVAATYLAREYHPDERDTITALIEGIRDPELCTELIEAELAVGPRQGVVAELNQRKHLLEQNPHLARPIEELGRRDVPDPAELPPRDVVFLDENGEPRDRSTSARSKVDAMRADRERSLAADGGANSDGGDNSDDDGAGAGADGDTRPVSDGSARHAPSTGDRDDRDGADDLEGST